MLTSVKTLPSFVGWMAYASTRMEAMIVCVPRDKNQTRGTSAVKVGSRVEPVWKPRYDICNINDIFSYLTDVRQQQCFMDVEGEATSNPVCKGQFSKNVTRTDCCCTGVGVAYGSECKVCPKRKTSKIQQQNSSYWSLYMFYGPV